MNTPNIVPLSTLRRVLVKPDGYNEWKPAYVSAKFINKILDKIDKRKII